MKHRDEEIDAYAPGTPDCPQPIPQDVMPTYNKFIMEQNGSLISQCIMVL